MDLDFLQALKQTNPDLPIVTIVTQVDRVRPLREWTPPYDWQAGTRPKEVAIREAVAYRNEFLADYCDLVLPLVNADPTIEQAGLGCRYLIISITPIDRAEQTDSSRPVFTQIWMPELLQRHELSIAIVIQMTTTQGLTQLLKSPVLEFISTMTTGTPALAQLLAAQIPVEQLPVVIGKLQMAYDLHSLLNTHPV